VESLAVEVSSLGQGLEVLHGLGGHIRPELELHVTSFTQELSLVRQGAEAKLLQMIKYLM